MSLSDKTGPAAVTPNERGTMIFASIPSPSQGVWNIGPIPIRAYALCILAGIAVATWTVNSAGARKAAAEYADAPIAEGAGVS